MQQSNLVGRMIRYIKDGGRKGWVGQITSVEGQRISVFYPIDSGIEQSYHISALMPENPKAFEDGYLEILPHGAENEDITLHLVTGERGGDIERCFGEETAMKVARAKAEKSRSGQKYYVFKAMSVFERETPPIKVTKLEWK